MRSSAKLSIAMTAALVAAAAGTGCATQEAKTTCYPVASWTSPVFRCSAPTHVAVVAPAPEPPKPEPAPAPEPEQPKPTAEVKTEKIELSETVQFEPDSATLLDRSKRLLDEVVSALGDHPEVKKVLIEGYTDSTATKKHNQKLSEDRVAAVKSYLVDKGIDANRLKTKGFGETHPVASNKTEDGRAKNRRVEFRIIGRGR